MLSEETDSRLWCIGWPSCLDDDDCSWNPRRWQGVRAQMRNFPSEKRYSMVYNLGKETGTLMDQFALHYGHISLNPKPNWLSHLYISFVLHLICFMKYNWPLYHLIDQPCIFPVLTAIRVFRDNWRVPIRRALPRQQEGKQETGRRHRGQRPSVYATDWIHQKAPWKGSLRLNVLVLVFQTLSFRIILHTFLILIKSLPSIM